MDITPVTLEPEEKDVQRTRTGMERLPDGRVAVEITTVQRVILSEAVANAALKKATPDVLRDKIKKRWEAVRGVATAEVL